MVRLYTSAFVGYYMLIMKIGLVRLCTENLSNSLPLD